MPRIELNINYLVPEETAFQLVEKGFHVEWTMDRSIITLPEGYTFGVSKMLYQIFDDRKVRVAVIKRFKQEVEMPVSSRTIRRYEKAEELSGVGGSSGFLDIIHKYFSTS